MLRCPAHLVCRIVVRVTHVKFLIERENVVFLITGVECPPHEHRDLAIIFFLNCPDWVSIQILNGIDLRRSISNRSVVLEVAIIAIRREEEDVRIIVHALSTWEEPEPATVHHRDNELNLLSFFDVTHIDLSALDLESLVRPRVSFLVAISIYGSYQHGQSHSKFLQDHFDCQNIYSYLYYYLY